MAKHDWESAVKTWLERHEIPEDTINKFMLFLWRKKQMWDLELMREMVSRRDTYE